MAQLKDLNVAGQSRFIGDVYANEIHGTLDSGGTASQLVAGNGTLQQIVSTITDSTTGIPNPKAVYDYVEAYTTGTIATQAEIDNLFTDDESSSI